MDDGSVMVVMIDSTSRYGLVRLVMTYMFVLWLTVLILFVIVMGHFSKKLIHPFIENDEKQKRFITNASHELKTPLAVISANTEMTEVLGGKSKWTESTRRQIKRLQTLIEDLVVLTRLDEMKESELTEVDLSAVVTESSESFRSVAENAGKRFTADIAPEIHIKGDKRGLQQIVSILLDNAVKYCDDGGTIAIRLESRSRGKGAKVIVSNTYVDGKDVDTSRFFERFYRQDESHNSEKSGFGIGLSMAKEITERMKGKLRVNYSGDTISFTVEV
jgi:signal transduction histidine kinase